MDTLHLDQYLFLSQSAATESWRQRMANLLLGRSSIVNL